MKRLNQTSCKKIIVIIKINISNVNSRNNRAGGDY